MTIGKDPEDIEEEAPSEEVVLEYMMDQDLPEEKDSREAPSREELAKMVWSMQSTISSLQRKVEDLEERLEETSVKTDQTERILEQLRSGELGGTVGSEILQELASPAGNTLEEARARRLYFWIVESWMVGDWIKTSTVKSQLNLEHNSMAHRAMRLMRDLCEDGHLLGTVEVELRRGTLQVRLIAKEAES